MPLRDLVHVHRVQQRLVIAGLEFVGADQEAIRVFLDAVGDLVAGKTVERGFGHFYAAIFMFSREGDNRLIGAFAFLQVFAEGMIVLDGPLDAAGDHHRPRLAADLVQADHLLMEMIDHDFGLESNGVIMGFHIAAQFLLGLLVSNSGSPSTFLTSL